MDLRKVATDNFSPAAQDLCGRESQVTCQKVYTVHLAGAEQGETGGEAGRGGIDLNLGNSPSSWGVRYVLQMKA